ncbi:MAG TPA: hypothetical protein VH186_07370 [Chloroflexia bacterium]|nr:hypothetical protein [Chloroflexia bacterium]
MIREVHIDRLAGALSANNRFRDAFLVNRLSAIEDYNRHYARRFGEKPIELNEEERQLVLTLRADSIQEVYETLALALENQAEKHSWPVSNLAHPAVLLPAQSSAA